MTRYNAPKLGKYMTVFGICVFFCSIIIAIVMGILDMKKQQVEEEKLVKFLDTYCEVVEYGLNKKPTKYSCDQVIFNVK